PPRNGFPAGRTAAAAPQGRQFMKCPKCGYLGFEPVDRCRNCGFDFSLSLGTPVAPDADLPMRTETRRIDSPADLPLVRDRMPLDEEPEHTLAGSMSRHATGTAAVSKRSMTDLPLFPHSNAGAALGTPAGSRIADDEPLITKPSAPRPPLAVRRATLEVPRVRVEQPRMQLFDLPPDSDRPSYVVRRTPYSSDISSLDGERDEWARDAPV